LIKPHPLFKRKGDDLYFSLPLNFSQFILGDKVEIPTLEGKKIFLKIPPHTVPETTFRIKNFGIPHYAGFKRGDLFVKTTLNIPKKLTKEQEELIKKLKEKGM
jgi:DnaJ-class molecular chaperone